MTSAGSFDQHLEILLSGADSTYTQNELAQKLRKDRPLRVKLGMDPTAPDLTLGHAVVLRKMRQFQDLGHKAVLIIGDYTAMIGDPSGRSKTRPMLTAEEIDRNAQTYMDQAGKILDLSPERFELRKNSEWLTPMTFADVIRLMSSMTVARMLERDTFANRQAQGKEIFLHELLYPLMQARDSVAIESDVELGGTDQTFNNLCGRDLQRSAGQEPQIVLVMPILVGIDGTNKMSKSLGNYVALTDAPSDMFGKLMRIPDEVMGNYFDLLTDFSAEDRSRYADPAKSNPRDSKEILAKTIITQFHSAMDADAAADEFRRVHGAGAGGLPDEVPEAQITGDQVQDGCIIPVDLVVACGFEKTRSGARRILNEGGIKINGSVINDALAPIEIKDGDIAQRGKRKFARLRLG